MCVKQSKWACLCGREMERYILELKSVEKDSKRVNMHQPYRYRKGAQSFSTAPRRQWGPAQGNPAVYGSEEGNI